MREKLIHILIILLLAGCGSGKGGKDYIVDVPIPPLIELREVTIISNQLIYDPLDESSELFGIAVIKNTGNVDLLDLSGNYVGGVMQGGSARFQLNIGESFTLDTRNMLHINSILPGEYISTLYVYDIESGMKIELASEAVWINIP